MLKLKLGWELESGEKFEEWTMPFELALAEKELFNGKSIGKVLNEDSASFTLFLYLAHKMQQRVTKKQENFEKWKSTVVDVQYVDVYSPNFTKPDQSGD